MRKIRAMIDETKENSEVKTLLETAGFIKKAELKDELVDNHDVCY